MTLLQTRAAPPPTSPHDTILVVQTPQGFRLPEGASTLTRALLDRPQEVQWAAVSVGVLLFAAAAFLVLHYRAPILRWLGDLNRAATLALGSLALVLVLGFGLAGWNGWQMMEHDNAFCTSCHLMHPHIARFYQTKHRRVECHDCHKQSVLSDMRELALWVFERPTSVGEHANTVPNRVCEGCHLPGRAPATIAASDPRRSGATMIDRSAGHTAHLRSSRQPGIECVQCHARPTPHVFKASNATCLQAGCHDDIMIKLVKMRDGVHDLRCTQCHDFLRPTGTIRKPFAGLESSILPIRDQCLGCHPMEQRVKGQNFGSDPHREQCGVCHNPHRQATAQATVASCARGGCHTRVDTVSSFHVGLPAQALAQCSACHVAHTWKAKGRVCATCHADPGEPLQSGPARPGRRSQLQPGAPAGVGTH